MNQTIYVQIFIFYVVMALLSEQEENVLDVPEFTKIYSEISKEVHNFPTHFLHEVCA